MYTPLENVVLKSGEEVAAGVVAAPDSQWRPRLQKLLFHKGEPWRRQITELLTQPLNVEARHYILHRGDAPFCHILTVESGSVGILGHVWTEPEERGQGAASRLMGLQMQDFRARGGRALYLSTGYDSSAYRIYARHGFAGVEPHSGVMAFFASSRRQFEAEYFAPGPANIAPLDWAHWATSSALFAGEGPGVVRNAALGLLGKRVTEGALIFALQEQREAGAEQANAEARVQVLQKEENGAVVGLAAWSRDATWPGQYIADVYCHAHFWQRAPELLAQLRLPEDARVVAYADAPFAAKREALEVAGFRVVASLPQWIAADAAQTGRVDVVVMERG
jgi:GNAT superfamily N-acetyltransferase